MKTVFVLDGSSPHRADERGTYGGKPLTRFEADGIAAQRGPGFEVDFRLSSFKAGNPAIEAHFPNHHAREEFRCPSPVTPAVWGKTGGFGPARFSLALPALPSIPE